MQITSQLTDEAVLEQIGGRISRWRLERNISQAELADQAGISRRTVQRLEDGEPVQTPSFTRVLRALGFVESLDSLVPEPMASPVDRLKREGRGRKRARGPVAASPQDPEPWVWGDEKQST